MNRSSMWSSSVGHDIVLADEVVITTNAEPLSADVDFDWSNETSSFDTTALDVFPYGNMKNCVDDDVLREAGAEDFSPKDFSPLTPQSTAVVAPLDWQGPMLDPPPKMLLDSFQPQGKACSGGLEATSNTQDWIRQAFAKTMRGGSSRGGGLASGSSVAAAAAAGSAGAATTTTIGAELGLLFGTEMTERKRAIAGAIVEEEEEPLDLDKFILPSGLHGFHQLLVPAPLSMATAAPMPPGSERMLQELGCVVQGGHGVARGGSGVDSNSDVALRRKGMDPDEESSTQGAVREEEIALVKKGANAKQGEEEGRGALSDRARPWACEQCSSRFSIKGHLSQHNRYVHEKYRPHTCPSCSASFGTRFARSQHVWTVHERKKPFVCEVAGCKARFGQRSHLNRHAKRHRADGAR